jgi:hypothetical protein
MIGAWDVTDAEGGYLLAGCLLLLAACASFGIASVQALGGGLCEGQAPGVCEAQQDDWQVWLAATVFFLVGRGLATAWRAALDPPPASLLAN